MLIKNLKNNRWIWLGGNTLFLTLYGYPWYPGEEVSDECGYSFLIFVGCYSNLYTSRC